jgi:hypothetical protein
MKKEWAMVRPVIASLPSLTLLLLPAGLAHPAEPARNPPGTLKTAIGKALPLLLRGAEGHVEHRTCFACHNQAIPLLALTTARERGWLVREKDLENQRQFIAAFLDKNRENYLKGLGQGGQVDTAGYALLALELGGWSPDATTDAVVEYLLQRHKEHDHWRATSKRPPSEASDFTTSYLAIRALRRWGTEGQQDRIAKRLDAARAWLLHATARDAEDRVFQLWALQEVGARAGELRPVAQQFLRSQRGDGGWAQTDALASDAYATGSSLVALHQTGQLATSDPAYQRGVAFLISTQQGDGSWLVRSRSKPFQIYYESGFPHGKDQFISIAATGWATTALALAYPPSAELEKAPRR